MGKITFLRISDHIFVPSVVLVKHTMPVHYQVGDIANPTLIFCQPFSEDNRKLVQDVRNILAQNIQNRQLLFSTQFKNTFVYYLVRSHPKIKLVIAAQSMKSFTHTSQERGFHTTTTRWSPKCHPNITPSQ